MTNIIDEKDVKIRKERKCFGCLRKYPVGTVMHHSTEVDDYLFHVYLCQECMTYLDTLPTYERAEGFCEGELLNYEDYPNRQNILDEVYRK